MQNTLCKDAIDKQICNDQPVFAAATLQYLFNMVKSANKVINHECTLHRK